ncbi:DUF6809 family protein [uncultured Dysosmobacter sp.]|uniref:DUF6809 family protein n=1 Tax=uncultured Dysosmobacter sp. TaxID=2591384 RepID=UPI00263173AC|nr:DUF6809 family protein [uncultured Dysosmobacter sp.]
MYNYMQALKQRFFQPPKYEKLRQDIERTHQELNSRLGERECNLLLGIMDMQTELCENISLDSFVAGFQLAYGITKELEEKGVYSFELEDEQLTCQRLRERREQANGKAQG